MAQQLSVSAPLIKIDVERRLVIARAAMEERDKTNEIMDYATAKPAFQKWSDSYAKHHIVGAEMSKGNVRVMHSRAVAGKVTEIAFNDDEKAVDVILKIDDDNEWKKCLAGNYTGLSIGGGYTRKWQDGGMTRYTPDVREISLVDNPCMPSARIVELVKADGMVEQLELRGTVRGFADSWKARPKGFAGQWAARPVAPRTFAALAKAEFDEAKHPRDEGGKFSAALEGGLGGLAVGAIGTGVAVGYGGKKLKSALHNKRNGTVRQEAATGLRANRNLRTEIVQEASRARKLSQSGSDPRTMELANAARRKVMEDAAYNASADPRQTKRAADAAFEQVRNARAKAGNLNAGRKAARTQIKTHIATFLKYVAQNRARGVPVSARTVVLASGVGALTGLGLGAYAGHKSITHSHDIADGKEPVKGAAVHAGDAARVTGSFAVGSLITPIYGAYRGASTAHDIYTERRGARAFAAQKAAQTAAATE